MIDRRFPSFWWSQVAGPSGFVSEIVDALMESRCVVLNLPNDLAWRHEMRNAFCEAMEVTPGLNGLFLEVTDVSDTGGDQRPSKYIMNNFVLPDDRLRYRPARETVQHYLMSNGSLAGRVVWVKGIDKGDVGAWMEFLAEWSPSSPDDGLFVVENREQLNEAVPSLRTIDYLTHADETSVRLFCWRVLSERTFRQMSDCWRKYAVALFANLCRDDVEVALILAEELDICREDPIAVIHDIATMPRFERRGTAGSSHVLTLAREGRQTELKSRLWSAQVETLFPLIESERSTIVDSLADQLAKKMEGNGIEQFGKKVESPLDVELGTLVHIMGIDAANDVESLTMDRMIRSRIFLLWRCRNLLAHRDTCCPQQVTELLDGFSSPEWQEPHAVRGG